MCWQEDMVTIVRFLINDLAVPSTHSDERLQQTILVAAQMVINEVDFATDYVVNLSEFTLTPDPTEGTKDNAFIELVSLKAGCMIDRGGYRQQLGIGGISVKIGFESIDTGGSLKGYETLFKEGLCKEYEDRKWDYETEQYVPGRILIGPFAGPNFNADTTLYNHERARQDI